MKDKLQLAILLRRLGIRATVDGRKVNQDPTLAWVVSERFINTRIRFVGNFESTDQWEAAIHADELALAQQLQGAGLIPYSVVDLSHGHVQRSIGSIAIEYTP